MDEEASLDDSFAHKLASWVARKTQALRRKLQVMLYEAINYSHGSCISRVTGPTRSALGFESSCAGETPM